METVIRKSRMFKNKEKAMWLCWNLDNVVNNMQWIEVKRKKRSEKSEDNQEEYDMRSCLNVKKSILILWIASGGYDTVEASYKAFEVSTTSTGQTNQRRDWEDQKLTVGHTNQEILIIIRPGLICYNLTESPWLRLRIYNHNKIYQIFTTNYYLE